MRALARREKERGELGEGKSGDKQSKSGGAAAGAEVLGVSSLQASAVACAHLRRSTLEFLGRYLVGASGHQSLASSHVEY